MPSCRGYQRPAKPVPGDCGYHLHAHEVTLSHPTTNEVSIAVIQYLVAILMFYYIILCVASQRFQSFVLMYNLAQRFGLYEG